MSIPEATHAPLPSTFGETNQRLSQVVQQWSDQLGNTPSFDLNGPVDHLPAHVMDNIMQTVNLALSNSATTHATNATIQISVSHDATQVVVADNGTGVGLDPSGQSFDDIRQLAQNLGGHVQYTENVTGGTQLTWTVPVTPEV